MKRGSVVGMGAAVWFVVGLGTMLGGWTEETTPQAKATVRQFMQGPSVFVKNAGQWEDARIRFALDSRGANVGLTDTGPCFQLFRNVPADAGESARLAMALPPREGGRPPVEIHDFAAVLDGGAKVTPEGRDRTAQKYNYLVGDEARRRENVEAFESVWYAGVYPGIDLEVRGRRTGLKYNFHVSPGADWRAIRIRYEGVDGLTLRADGALEIRVKDGWPPLVDGAPVVFQERDGQRVPVAGAYALFDGLTYGFTITGAYDPAQPLVIDPEVNWGTTAVGDDSDAQTPAAAESVKWVWPGIGGLRGLISPQAAIDAGAQWRRRGTETWIDSGSTRYQGIGSYWVEFKDVPEWVTPPDQAAVVKEGVNTTVPVTYAQAAGSVQVIISPQTAIDAGAQWRRVGTETWRDSGYVESLEAGAYTLEFKHIPPLVAPSNQTVMISQGDNLVIPGGYVPGPGFLSVVISPQEVIDEGAQWRRVGTEEWLHSGRTESLDPGQYVVEFTDVPGWVTPSTQLITVNAGETSTLLYIYQRPAVLQVYISPQEAVDAGAQWRLVGTETWRSSGYREELEAGQYTVEFKCPPHWNAPPNQDIVVPQGDTAVHSAVFVPDPSFLQVTLSPPEVIEDGAHWRVDSGAWLESGESTFLPPGMHTVTYQVVPFWTTPPDEVYEITLGDPAITATGVYVREPSGFLQMTLSPAEAIAAGAQWRCMETGDWNNSGDSEQLSPGPYTVEFKAVPAWITPPAQDVSVADSETTTGAGEYEPEPGLLQVILSPQEAVDVGAQWRRVGTSAWQDSGNTESLSPGLYAMEFKEVEHWETPPIQEASINSGETSVLTGCYVPIAPPELSWSTYIGGGGGGQGGGIAVDDFGSVYVASTVTAAGWASGGWDTTYNGGTENWSEWGDGYVLKLNAAGVHAWSTFLGGRGLDGAADIAVDKNGGVYVTGTSRSAGWVFGGWRGTSDGIADGYLVKLTTEGAHVWSTGLGEMGLGVAVDAASNVYVTGITKSESWPGGGWDPTYNGGTSDGFVMKFSSSGKPLWSTYLGGENSDAGYAIAVGASGEVYVTGDTRSAGWVSGGWDTSWGGSREGFVVSLTSTGEHRWSTYLGGGGSDYGDCIAVDGPGNLYVVGNTNSAGWIAEGWNTEYSGGTDGYVLKLSPLGDHLWSTYLGGTGSDDASGICPDNQGNVYVCGTTTSEGWIGGGWDNTLDGGKDAYVVKLSPSSEPEWSSYLGGDKVDCGYDIALDPTGFLCVTGLTYSRGWVSGGWDNVHHASPIGFAAKIALGKRLVPNVLGRSLYIAEAIIDSAGLEAGTVVETYDEEVPKGCISHQEPVAGTESGPGMRVDLVVSLGPEPGALEVIIVPEEVNRVGALWQEMATAAWRASGDIYGGLPAGQYGVRFKPALGWITPPNQTATVIGGETAQITGTYAAQTVEGALQVTIEPEGAITAGGQWRRVGTDAWLESGYLDTGFTAGQCTVEYRSIVGWATAPSQEVMIASGETVTWTGTYTREPERVGAPELSWSTCMGRADTDGAVGITLDGRGNVYILTELVPVLIGPYIGGLTKAFNPQVISVVKISPDGEHQWSTYLGGGEFEMGTGIAADAAGNVYATGLTMSPGWVSGGWDSSFAGTSTDLFESDGFLVKLSPNGTHAWSTYLGGSGFDYGYDVALDASGDVYAVGNTDSTAWMSGVPGTAPGGSGDAFVVKLSSSGEHRWSTCLGGSGFDEGRGIAVDGSGRVYVTGMTESVGWVDGGWNVAYSGQGDGYVAALNASGSRRWSTYLGGSALDEGNDVAVDGSGNVYVSGTTRSAGWLSGGWDSTLGGDRDGFVVKLSSDGAYAWSTYFGGVARDEGHGVTTDAWGNVYAAGFTNSAGWMRGGSDVSYGGDTDGYVVKLRSNGVHQWSTYVGGTDTDVGYGVAVDAAGSVYATGYTWSTDWLNGSCVTSPGGYTDGFVVKLSQTGAPVAFAAPDAVGHSRGDAEDMVTGAGVSVGLVTELYHESVPAGQVISQSVPPGTPMEPGTMIDLVVSMGPDPSQTEGSSEGDGEGLMIGPHCADQDGDYTINLTELLRVIQFFNVRGYQCVTLPATSEDGYLPGTGEEHACAPHTSDYSPQDWQINLTELLRLIQFFNLRAYHPCPEMSTEDGYCPGAE